MVTAYPSSGKVNIKVKSCKYGEIYLRKPAWCDKFTVSAPYEEKDGYIVVGGNENEIVVDYEMEPFFIESNPKAFEMTDCTEEDNVSVLTMHKSKGLEYPVVIVCGLEKSGNLSDESAEVLLDREYGFATKLYKDQEKISSSTIVRGLFKERIAEKRRKEEQRIFYVALTRAAYSLHMICESKTDPRTESFVYADKFIGFVPKSLNKTIHYYSSLEDETKVIEKKSVLFSKLNLEMTERFKEHLSYVYPFSEDVLLPLKATVTGVTSKKEEYYLTYQIGDYDKTGAEAGTIAHKILETYAFDGGDLALHAEKLVKDGIITNEEKSLINFERLNKALSLEIFKEVSQGKKYREQPFITSISANKILNVKSSESVLIQGIIDLLVKTEKGYIIIDYKYSRLDSEKLKEKYSAQIELYSYAIEKILGEKVIKRALVNVYSGEVIIV
jgi:ATP-dependent helicase/nuclease subunit A